MTMLAAPYRTAREAIEVAKAEPGMCAILLNGMHLVVDRESAEHLSAEGVSFAYLGWCATAGRVVTVPVN